VGPGADSLGACHWYLASVLLGLTPADNGMWQRALVNTRCGVNGCVHVSGKSAQPKRSRRITRRSHVRDWMRGLNDRGRASRATEGSRMNRPPATLRRRSWSWSTRRSWMCLTHWNL